VNRGAVLVVDDQPGMRETLVDILEAAGHEATPAPDGETALELVRANRYDVVVMDIKMPGRDGVSVAREMGEPPPAIILMTAYALDEQLQAAVSGNTFALVHKPIPVPYLLELIETASSSFES
jgi:CheY-like chemotaxis protein